jgi:hypothetical protein
LHDLAVVLWCHHGKLVIRLNLALHLALHPAPMPFIACQANAGSSSCQSSDVARKLRAFGLTLSVDLIPRRALARAVLSRMHATRCVDLERI